MGMKLVVAIVQNDDADELIDALTSSDYRATRLASTGGFLRQGNTTIIVGIPAESVNQVLNIVAGHAHPHHQNAVPNPFPTPTTVTMQTAKEEPAEVQTAKATIFVLDLERYERI
jgi:uncharacterized protein YaaQ